ncbi:hypothetical protein [Kitasatospora sp. NPDC058218]|uniref:hypothetical protein n=1 Tax=Kitasatospora sp. NPDC058218 TaxID=3346385 RepID=UPI0036DA207E
MTLNITVLTADRIYQSADFCLSYPGGKRSHSMKVVTLQYSDFFGMLTYTGVGEWHKDTSQWVIEWLSPLGDASLENIAEELARRASDWIRQIGTKTGRIYPHTFVLAAFRRGRASVTVVSNFENAVGLQSLNPGQTFSISKRDFDGQVRVVVTGWKPAVQRYERKALLRFVRRHLDNPQAIRNSMADLNESAARSPEGSTISVECTVVSMNSDGSGLQELTPGSKVEFRNLALGMSLDVAKVLAGLGAKGAQLVGASFAQVGPSAAPLGQPSTCVPSLVNTQEAAGYELIELAGGQFKTARAGALNQLGTVLGAGATEPSDYCLWTWREGESVQLLPVPYSTTDLSMGINNEGAIAGTVADSSGYLRALGLYGQTISMLDDAGGRDSGVRAINSRGSIVGWVCIDSVNRGQLNYRPAVWAPNAPMVILSDLPAQWGEAIGVNSEGCILLGVHEAVPFLQRPILFTPGGDLRECGSAEKGISPLGITNEGLVLASANMSGKPVTLMCRPGQPWDQLHIPEGWVAGAISPGGWMAGSFRDSGFSRPWVRRPDGKTILLPYLRHHHCAPTAIDDHGNVAGRAEADHGEHAIFWRGRSQI